jgi:hypothetical protein
MSDAYNKIVILITWEVNIQVFEKTGEMRNA